MIKKLKFTIKEKELIAKFIRESRIPDYDGCMGNMYYLPEELMVVYKKLFPNDWDGYSDIETRKKFPTGQGEPK